MFHEERGKMYMKKIAKELLRMLALYIILMAIFVFLFRTVFMLTLIPTGSMDSTIEEENIVFATRYDIGEEDIERYDILIFIPPDNSDNLDVTYIKRVIGLPGESVRVSKQD